MQCFRNQMHLSVIRLSCVWRQNWFPWQHQSGKVKYVWPEAENFLLGFSVVTCYSHSQDWYFATFNIKFCRRNFRPPLMSVRELTGYVYSTDCCYGWELTWPLWDLILFDGKMNNAPFCRPWERHVTRSSCITECLFHSVNFFTVWCFWTMAAHKKNT